LPSAFTSASTLRPTRCDWQPPASARDQHRSQHPSMHVRLPAHFPFQLLLVLPVPSLPPSSPAALAPFPRAAADERVWTVTGPPARTARAAGPQQGPPRRTPC